MEAIDFIKANWETGANIAGIIAFAFIVGERVAAVTENKTDDKVFAVIHKILVFLKIKFPEAK